MVKYFDFFQSNILFVRRILHEHTNTQPADKHMANHYEHLVFDGIVTFGRPVKKSKKQLDERP